jgi:glycosyltransferase involved in cell wall biosynthesis
MPKRKTILIAGPLPPPAGGISIHIHRLQHVLKEHYNIILVDESRVQKPGIFNLFTFRFFTYLSLVKQADLLFIHSGNRFFKKLHILMGRIFRKKILITIHGYGKKRLSMFRRWDELIYGLAHQIILVNKEIYQKVQLPPGKCIIRNAFLPPILDEEKPLPTHVQERIHQAKREGKIILSNNASRLDTFKGQDLYGLDICLKAVHNLVKEGIPVDCIFCVSSLSNGKERFDAAQEYIKTHQLESNFLLINEKMSFVQLISKSDLVLRTTNTDGDSLTIRESLYLKKPVLASDAVKRPTGTHLFISRDQEDLNYELKRMVQSIQFGKSDHILESRMEQEGDPEFYVRLIEDMFHYRPDE